MLKKNINIYMYRKEKINYLKFLIRNVVRKKNNKYKLKDIYSFIDKLKNKKILHKNKTNRIKSKIAKKIINNNNL